MCRRVCYASGRKMHSRATIRSFTARRPKMLDKHKLIIHGVHVVVRPNYMICVSRHIPTPLCLCHTYPLQRTICYVRCATGHHNACWLPELVHLWRSPPRRQQQQLSQPQCSETAAEKQHGLVVRVWFVVRSAIKIGFQEDFVHIWELAI